MVLNQVDSHAGMTDIKCKSKKKLIFKLINKKMGTTRWFFLSKYSLVIHSLSQIIIELKVNGIQIVY